MECYLSKDAARVSAAQEADSFVMRKKMRETPNESGLTRLRQAGLRPTRQRNELADLLFRNGHRHLTAEALHANFKWAPCQVLGHILYQEQKLQFVITAASTGEIQVAPGKTVEFGCNSSCAEMFAYGYPVPPAATATLPASRDPH